MMAKCANMPKANQFVFLLLCKVTNRTLGAIAVFVLTLFVFAGVNFVVWVRHIAANASLGTMA